MACQIQVQASAGALELVIPDDKTCELVAQQWAGTASADEGVESQGGTDRAWKALVRRLVRTNPEYMK